MNTAAFGEAQHAAPLSRIDHSAFLAAILLIIAFFIATVDLQGDSLWNDEGWSVWAVHSPYLADMLARVRSDVHPPLYFFLLDGWVRVAGESVYALRLLSTFFGMTALAATYAVGKKVVDRQTGLLALVILGTASFFVYYTREVRMYTLLLALGALATWAYLLWRDRPTRLRTLVYSLLMAALLYTHYAGALIILTHLIHLALTNVRSLHHWRRDVTLLIPFLLAGFLYLPWLPIFLNQMRANPNGPLAIPVHTDWAAVAALVLILTGSSWWLYVAPFFLGRAIPRLRQYNGGVLLLLLWLLLTPVILLALNAWVAPVYQVRYAIAMLPAGALLVAYGLRWIGLPLHLLNVGFQRKVVQSNANPVLKFLFLLRRRTLPKIEPSSPFLRVRGKGVGGIGVQSQYVFAGLSIFLLLWIAQSQLAIYPELWPPKPPWESTIRAMIAARNPLDPTITDIADYSPVAYYDRLLKIRQGISLDLSWRLHHYDEIIKLVGLFKKAPSVWVALPINTAKTWHIVAALDAGRHAAYRSSLVNMIFYRFDQGESGDLQYRFGDLLRFVSGPRANLRFSVSPGGSVCADLEFKTLAPLDGSYSAGLHLVDITGTTVLVPWDGGLGTAAAGDSLKIKPCLDIPANAPPGYYHLELIVYQWKNQERLHLFEDGSGDPLLWGDVLMLAAVDVAG